MDNSHGVVTASATEARSLGERFWHEEFHRSTTFLSTWKLSQVTANVVAGIRAAVIVAFVNHLLAGV
jgi:hypothetical protein